MNRVVDNRGYIVLWVEFCPLLPLCPTHRYFQYGSVPLLCLTASTLSKLLAGA
jgi:hypothetical protein